MPICWRFSCHIYQDHDPQDAKVNLGLLEGRTCKGRADLRHARSEFETIKGYSNKLLNFAKKVRLLATNFFIP